MWKGFTIDEIKGYVLGKNIKRIAQNFNIKWQNGPIELLDVTITDEKDLHAQRNMGTKIQKLKNMINLWK